MNPDRRDQSKGQSAALFFRSDEKARGVRCRPSASVNAGRDDVTIPPFVSLPLRTARLTLRDFVPDDFVAIHAYASDPEVTRFMFHGVRDA